MSDESHDELLALLMDPDGLASGITGEWRTTADILRAMGRSVNPQNRAVIREQMRPLVVGGVIECRRISVTRIDGVPTKVPAYRKKPNGS